VAAVAVMIAPNTGITRAVKCSTVLELWIANIISNCCLLAVRTSFFAYEENHSLFCV